MKLNINIFSGNQFHSTNNVSGNQIEAANNCPGAGAGHNTNCGSGAAGVNSGPAAGSINNYNVSETTLRQAVSEGNQGDAPLADGGSGGRVQSTRFDQGVCKLHSKCDKNIIRWIVNIFDNISSTSISRAWDRKKNGYGFDTFSLLVDQEGSEKLDKTWLGTNFREYHASPDRSSRNQMETEGNMKVRDASRAIDARESSACGLSGDMGIPEQRDDAVAVEGDKKIIEFQTAEEEKAWLYPCPVGCLRELKDVGMVEKNLREQGFTFSKATHTGDDLVLLECPNNDHLSTLINKGRDLLRQHFQWVKPWSPKINEVRHAYLRFEGVPPHALTERFFRMVVGNHIRGMFISMDSTINRIQLDVAEVLITTSLNEMISEHLTPKIDSIDYNVKVIEETDQNSASLDSDRDIFDKDSLRVDSRSEGEQSDLCKGDDMDTESTVQQKYCSLGSTQDIRRKGDEETGSSDKGSQEIGGSSKPHNNPSDELGTQNMVSKRSNAKAEPFSPKTVPKRLNAEAVPFSPKKVPKRLNAEAEPFSPFSPKTVPKKLNAEAEPFSPKMVSPADLSLLRTCNGPLDLNKSNELYVNCGSYSMCTSTSNENRIRMVRVGI